MMNDETNSTNDTADAGEDLEVEVEAELELKADRVEAEGDELERALDAANAICNAASDALHLAEQALETAEQHVATTQAAVRATEERYGASTTAEDWTAVETARRELSQAELERDGAARRVNTARAAFEAAEREAERALLPLYLRTADIAQLRADVGRYVAAFWASIRQARAAWEAIEARCSAHNQAAGEAARTAQRLGLPHDSLPHNSRGVGQSYGRALVIAAMTPPAELNSWVEVMLELGTLARLMMAERPERRPRVRDRAALEHLHSNGVTLTKLRKIDLNLALDLAFRGELKGYLQAERRERRERDARVEHQQAARDEERQSKRRADVDARIQAALAREI